jgi:surfeit locus 1 family protein
MTSPRPAGLEFDFEWRLTLFTLLMLPLLAGLGFWQLARAEEKAQLQARFEQRRQQTPVTLAVSLAKSPAAKLADLPVLLSGEYLDDYLLLDNRLRDGRFGYEVLSPLALARGGIVLVNRGWIPGDPARQSLPAVATPAAARGVPGRIYVPPGEPYQLGETVLAPDGQGPSVIPALDMPALVAAGESRWGESLFPFSVRLEEGAPGALRAGWPVVNVSPAKHTGYAVQWFTMAAVLALFFLFRSSNLGTLLRRNTHGGS